MAGDLMNALPGLSLRHLSRKLAKSIQFQSGEWLMAKTGRAQRHHQVPMASKPSTWLASTARQLSRPWWVAPLLARQVGDHSPWPSIPAGSQPKVRLPCPGHEANNAGEPPPGGRQCQHILDPYGQHAARCTKGLHTRRHGRIQRSDHQTCLASRTHSNHWTGHAHPRSAPRGWTACPGQRASHPQGWHSHHWTTGLRALAWMWQIHTVNPDLAVAKELLREELTKCRAYGQRDGFNLQTLDRGMIPVVLEQFGRTAPGAQAIFNRIINHRLQVLVRQGIPFSFAKRTASSELWGPISLYAAPSSLASPCRVCTPNRPGRLGWHTLQLAELPRGVSVRSMSAWVAGRRLERSDEHLAKRSGRQTSRQFASSYDNLQYFMTISVSLFHWHKTS